MSRNPCRKIPRRAHGEEKQDWHHDHFRVWLHREQRRPAHQGRRLSKRSHQQGSTQPGIPPVAGCHASCFHNVHTMGGNAKRRRMAVAPPRAGTGAPPQRRCARSHSPLYITGHCVPAPSGKLWGRSRASPQVRLPPVATDPRRPLDGQSTPGCLSAAASPASAPLRPGAHCPHSGLPHLKLRAPAPASCSARKLPPHHASALSPVSGAATARFGNAVW